MILSDKHLLKLLKRKILTITPSISEGEIRCNHINLHLSDKLLKYRITALDLKNNELGDALTEEIIISENGFELKPGDFILGSTLEKIEIPKDISVLLKRRAILPEQASKHTIQTGT